MLKKNILIFIALVLLTFSSLSHARSWTCHATINLEGSNYKYTVPGWNMSGNAFVDREKKCKNSIQSNWLNNGKIWKKLGMNAANQNKFCKRKGTFRVDYGFNKRKKSWDFRKTLSSPSCKCPSTSCPSGLSKDKYGGCVRKLCKTSRPNNSKGLSGSPRTGIFSWNGYVYEIIPPIQSGGMCTFK